MGERETWQELPLDIVYKIILSFPLKTLGRLRCVCKTWSSLISHPRFQKQHYKHSQQNPFLLVIINDFDEVNITNTLHFSTYTHTGNFVKTFSKTVPPEDQYTGMLPIQSCLGLVCLGDAHCADDTIMICNPSTEELIIVPPPPFRVILRQCVGFGYAASTKEFKAVRFSTRGTTNYCHVFTLGTCDWREARTQHQQHPTVFGGRAYFLHGALHLLPYHPHNVHHATCSLVAFDIESEEYRGIPLPKSYDSNCSRIAQLTELGGSLCVVGKPNVQVELWLLKGKNSNRAWVKEYAIDISSLSNNGVFYFQTLAIVRDGSIWVSLLLETPTTTENKLLCYSTHSKTVIREIKIPRYCAPSSYTESFLSYEWCPLIGAEDE